MRKKHCLCQYFIINTSATASSSRAGVRGTVLLKLLLLTVTDLTSGIITVRVITLTGFYGRSR